MAGMMHTLANSWTLRPIIITHGIARSGFAALLLIASILIAAPNASAKYASIIVNAKTGEIVHGTNVDTRNYPASLTKMMTLFMVFEALDAKRWTLHTRLKVSHRAARQPAGLGEEAAPS